MSDKAVIRQYNAALAQKPDRFIQTHQTRQMTSANADKAPCVENVDRLSITGLTGGDIFKQENFCFHNSKPHNQFLYPVRAQMNDSLDRTEKAGYLGNNIEYMHLKFHIIKSVKTILKHRMCKEDVLWVYVSEVCGRLEG